MTQKNLEGRFFEELIDNDEDIDFRFFNSVESLINYRRMPSDSDFKGPDTRAMRFLSGLMGG